MIGVALEYATLHYAANPWIAVAAAVAAARSSWMTAHNYIVRSAEQMSEADFAFKPVATVRSFAQIVAHVQVPGLADQGHRRRICAEEERDTDADGVPDVYESGPRE